jgi:urease accessory protein
MGIVITMGTIIMTTSTELLTLAQWLSPAYPVGAFAYSHGLEYAITHGDVTDPESLGRWVAEVLEHGTGRSDALFLAAAYSAQDPAAIDAIARAFASSAERLRETLEQGASFAKTTRAVWEIDLPDLAYPVALGRAARLLGLPQHPPAALYLQAFGANLVSVGQRLIPIGQTEAQRLIRGLSPLCARLATETEQGDLSTLSNTAFLADIAAMRHETQEVRVFRT